MQIPPAHHGQSSAAAAAFAAKQKAAESASSSEGDGSTPAKASPVATQAAEAARVLQHEAMEPNLNSINTGKLENLKTNLDGIVTSLEGSKESFLDSAFGPGQGDQARVGSTLDAIKGMESSHSKNPLDAMMHDNYAGGGAGHLMQDAPEGGGAGGAEGKEEPSTWESIKTWASSVVGSIFGGAGAKTTVGNGAGAAGGTAFGVLTANTESPEAKGNEFRGWAAFVNMARGNYYHPGMNQVDDPFAPPQDGHDKMPTPDGDTGPQTVITRDDLRGIGAKLGGRIEPVDDGLGHGGPVNPGATGEGKVAQQAEFVDNGVSQNVTINSAQLKGIEARINAKINPPT